MTDGREPRPLRATAAPCSFQGTTAPSLLRAMAARPLRHAATAPPSLCFLHFS